MQPSSYPGRRPGPQKLLFQTPRYPGHALDIDTDTGPLPSPPACFSLACALSALARWA